MNGLTSEIVRETESRRTRNTLNRDKDLKINLHATQTASTLNSMGCRDPIRDIPGQVFGRYRLSNLWWQQQCKDSCLGFDVSQGGWSKWLPERCQVYLEMKIVYLYYKWRWLWVINEWNLTTYLGGWCSSRGQWGVCHWQESIPSRSFGWTIPTLWLPQHPTNR